MGTFVSKGLQDARAPTGTGHVLAWERGSTYGLAELNTLLKAIRRRAARERASLQMNPVAWTAEHECRRGGRARRARKMGGRPLVAAKPSYLFSGKQRFRGHTRSQVPRH
jgi:hypothetical protein